MAEQPHEAELDDELQQVNVRLYRRRVHQARRLAASRGESLPEFLDRLILGEVEREQQTLMELFTREEEDARRAKQQLLLELQNN